MKILVTGFEPFGRWQRNPSGETALHLNGTIVGGAKVSGLRLPVSFRRAAAPLIAAIDEVHPDVVLNLGLGAPGGIRVERVAVNRCTAPPGGDNDGYDPDGEPVLSDGPATYRSTLPVASIVYRLSTLGFGAAPSDSAGEFLCNYSMYMSLHHISTHRLPIRAGFIHGSPLPEAPSEQGEGWGMQLMEWVAFTEAVIGVLDDRH